MENEWQKIVEENYPEDRERVLIAYKFAPDSPWQYWIYGSGCPFGWNVLCRSNAYCKKIISPEEEKTQNKNI